MNKNYWKSIFLCEFSLISVVSLGIFYKMGFSFNTNSVGLNEVEAKVVDATDYNKTSGNKIETKNSIDEEILKSLQSTSSNDFTIAAIQDEEAEDTNVSVLYDIKEIEAEYKDKIKKSYYTNITSYNSEAAQTDDSPCITASNMDVCERDTEDIVATNDLPLHTKILIPEYFGDRIFYVEDRMNERYTGTGRVDIWMKNKENSKKWGIKNTKIVVLKN